MASGYLKYSSKLQLQTENMKHQACEVTNALPDWAEMVRSGGVTNMQWELKNQSELCLPRVRKRSVCIPLKLGVRSHS